MMDSIAASGPPKDLLVCLRIVNLLRLSADDLAVQFETGPESVLNRSQMVESHKIQYILRLT